MEGDQSPWVGAQAGAEGSPWEVEQQEEPEDTQGTDQIHQYTEANGIHASCLGKAVTSKKKEKTRMNPGLELEVSL